MDPVLPLRGIHRSHSYSCEVEEPTFIDDGSTDIHAGLGGNFQSRVTVTGERRHRSFRGNQIDEQTGLDERGFRNLPFQEDSAIVNEGLDERFQPEVEDLTNMNATQPKGENPLHFNFEDKLSWFTAFLLGVQNLFITVWATLFLVFQLVVHICMYKDDPALTQMFSTTLFICGISTILQNYLGIRLPIVQLPSWLTFTLAGFGATSIYDNNCEDSSGTFLNAEGVEQRIPAGQYRIKTLQGALFVGSAYQIILGLSGVMGFLSKIITPVSLVSMTAIVGISMIHYGLDVWVSTGNIPAFVTIVLLVVVRILNEIPFPCWNREKKFHLARGSFFKIFAVLLVGVIASILDFLLRNWHIWRDDREENNHFHARSLLVNLSWAHLPYPFQFGFPSITSDAAVGMIMTMILATHTSMTNYYACAKACGKATPTAADINRGIVFDGISSLLGSFFGMGVPVTSSTAHVGMISLTNVGNRRVVLSGAVVLIVISFVPRLAAELFLLADPISNTFVLISSVIYLCSGLFYLEDVSPRNMFVIGVSVSLALILPETVFGTLRKLKCENEILLTAMSSNILIGFPVVILLDNVIPGRKKERNINSGQNLRDSSQNERDEITATAGNIYELPQMSNTFSAYPLIMQQPH